MNTGKYVRDYRFTFQSQESDDEISGGIKGAHLTAEFWEYDSKIARRWNIDPIDKPWESSFLGLGNNPICFIDLNGADTAVFGSDNKFVEIKPGGDNIGQKLGDDGFYFKFADPNNDMKSISTGDITKIFVAEDDIILQDFHVMPERSHSPFNYYMLFIG